MNALAPTAPMKIGRCTALRARAVSQTGRAIARGNSPVICAIAANLRQWMTCATKPASLMVLARTGPHPTPETSRAEPTGSALAADQWTTTPQAWLLHGERALHPHREVRCAMKWIRTGLNSAERDRHRFARVHHHRAGKLRQLPNHVGVQLVLRLCGDRSRIECNIVWAT